MYLHAHRQAVEADVAKQTQKRLLSV